MLEIDQLACGYGKHPVLTGISLTLQPGELLCLLGPNGIGKTTLFKTLLGLMPRLGGNLRIEGEDIRRWPRKRLAQWMGYVPQAHTPPFPFRVLEVVSLGRAAHLGAFAAPSRQDERLAAAMLETLGIGHLAQARYTEISGGERQLVLIARALVQTPRILVMDEPTSNLDYGNQLRVLAHIRRIALAGEMAVILTTHHPDHALLYASRALVLDRDRQHAIGPPAQVITADYLRAAYGIDAEIHSLQRRSGSPVRICVPGLPDQPPPAATPASAPVSAPASTATSA